MRDEPLVVRLQLVEEAKVSPVHHCVVNAYILQAPSGKLCSIMELSIEEFVVI